MTSRPLYTSVLTFRLDTPVVEDQYVRVSVLVRTVLKSVGLFPAEPLSKFSQKFTEPLGKLARTSLEIRADGFRRRVFIPTLYF